MNSHESTQNKSRLGQLDGLRGLAILLVIAYHTFARWPEHYPYGINFEGTPIAYGYVGVQLFFLISGFVIFLSLDKTKGIYSFLIQRWLRLFPAMLLCSALIIVTGGLISMRPAGDVRIIDALPGITFIDPGIWSKILEKEIKSLEGGFWTLYVEVKFYLISSLIFYVFGRKYVAPAISALFLVGAISAQFLQVSGNSDLNRTLGMLPLSTLLNFGWFASGSFFYLAFRSENIKSLLAAVCLALVASLAPWKGVNHFVASAAMLVIFYISLNAEYAKKVFELKPLVFFGYISYPVYLLNENAIVSLTAQLSPALGETIPYVLTPAIPLVIIFFVSWTVTKYGEPWIRDHLARWIKHR